MCWRRSATCCETRSSARIFPSLKASRASMKRSCLARRAWRIRCQWDRRSDSTMNRKSIQLISILTVFILVCGCGGGQKKRDHGFFTSGDKEADQRADQRMAQTEQIRGSGEGTGEKK